jgi:hypothetical protein
MTGMPKEQSGWQEQPLSPFGMPMKIFKKLMP